MSKNTVIKIVSIVACVALVAGIVLLVCLLPKGGKTQQIELQLFTAESAENITASTEKGSVKFLNSSGEEISSTLTDTTYSLTITQNEKITLNFNASTGYGFAGLYSTPDFETNSLITNNPSYELNTENQPTKLFAKFGKLENLTLEIQTTEQGATQQISKTFPITICLTQEEILPIIEENFPTATSLYTAENKCIGMTENTNPSKTFVFNSESSIIKIKPTELDAVGADYTITFDPNGGTFPNDYIEIEYIKATGSQTISLNYKPNKNTKMQFRFIYSNSGGICFIGSFPSDTSDYRFFSSGSSMYFDLPGGTGSGTRIIGTSTFNATDIYEYEIGNYYVKDLVSQTTLMSGSYTSFSTCSVSASLFGNTDYGTIYYLKIFESSNIVRDYVPCKRTSDNAIGLFDKVTQTFYGNSGSGSFTAGSTVTNTIYTNKTVSSGSTYNTLPTPTRTGYTFAGWWTSATGGTQVTASTTATAATTLYAHWTPNVHTITLDNQSATTAGTTAIYEWREIGYYKESACTTQMTTSANPISVPAKNNYAFGGYFTATNGGGTKYIDADGKLTSSASNTNFSANGTLYANWICLITLNNQSATTAGTASIYEWQSHGYYLEVNCTNKMSTSANGITVPTRTGCFFRGYYTAELGGGTQYIDANGKLTSSASATNFTANGNLYAKWDYTITLDGQLPTTAGTTKIYESYNGGYYLNSDCTTQMSTTANKIDIPTKAGELFGGYYTETNGNGTQYIDRRGFLTTGASTTNFTAIGSLYAYWIHLAGGLGTSANPYLISTAEHLYNLTNHVDDGNSCAGQYFKVSADIGSASSPVSWTLPIGTTAEKPFEGNFDGNNHKITYNYNSSTYQYAGLFGYYTGSTIQNLSVGGILNNTKTDGYVGGVVAYSKNALTLTNCSSTANVNALTYAGGLIGYAKTALTLANCYNTGGITGLAYSGGLIAYADSTTSITNSYNNGNISLLCSGGLIGCGNSLISIINSYNTGTVNASSFAGGLVGQGKSATTIKNSYNIGNVYGLSNAGGVIACGDSTTIITNCYNSGKIFKDVSTKGAGLSGNGGIVVNCFYLYGCCEDGAGEAFNGKLEIGSLLERLNGFVVENSSEGYKYWKVVVDQNKELPMFSDTLLSYTITFNLNGGQGGPYKLNYTHYSVFTVPVAEPKKDNSSFVCWNDKANGTGTSYSPNEAYIFDSNKILYAIYVESGGGGDVTIQLCANGGEFVNAQEQTIKSRDVGGIVTLERPTRNGFRFLGYNTKADGSGTDITTMKVSEDIALFAQWEPMEYYVKYYDGATLLKTDTIPANQQKALSSWTAMKTGQTTAEANNWVFYGWATSNSSFERAYENLAIIENITTFGETINLYAIYSKVLTVNYNGNEATSGSVEEDKSQTIYLSASKTMSNYSVTLKANEFARTNYHFSKWAFGSATGTQFAVGATFTQANSSLSWNNSSTFTKTFYAVWEGNSYTINYYNGTTKASEATYTYGTNSALKTFASLNQTIANQLYGWKFSGWAIANNSITKTFNDGANITNIDIGGSEITQGLTIDLYAIYERTIAFHSGKNCATNSTATQTWNPYSTNASNISSVEAPVPTSLQSEHWITLGYRADQSAGLATYAVQTATNITPAVDTLNDLYAVYSKEVTIALTDKTTTTTTYYNTSGDLTEITTIS